MASILGIGVATLDIVNLVDHYPAEDEEMRAQGQRCCPGGNAANSLYVLSQLGHHAQLAAVLADDVEGGRLAELLQARGIDLSLCPREPGRTPTSYITLNRSNGSRTIVHFRDLPDLEARHLSGIEPQSCDWVHVQARDGQITGRILQTLRSRHSRHLPISLEVEKEREGVDNLLGQPDVIFFSRAFAIGRGFDEPEAFLRTLHRKVPGAVLVCTWGEAGAWAWVGRSGLHHVPAHAPERVEDTLAAGDTFNAGVIHGLVSGLTVHQALEFASRLAGHKVGQQGLEGLGAWARDNPLEPGDS